MAKYIEVGQDVIEFPDDMTDAQIEQVLASQFGSATQEAPSTPEMPPVQPVTTTRPGSVWEEAGRQLGLTARGALTGVAGLPLMMAEPVAAGVNLLAGREVFPSQQQAFQQVLTNMGLPEPQGAVERAVQSGVAAMAGTGAQAQLAQAAGPTSVFAPMAREVPQQLAAAGAAGTAAQAASDLATEEGYSPLANFAVSLAAGSLAGLAGAKAARVATADKAPRITIDQVKQEAQRAYTKVDDAGITVKPLPVLKTIDDIESTLTKDFNFNPKLDTHAPIKTILDGMRQMVGSQRVSFSKLDQLRQSAVDLTRSNDAATRRLAGKVVEQLDAKIASLQPNELITGKQALAGALKDVKEARDSWRKVSKATILEDALNIAEARALAPNASEGELIRTQFKNLAANKNKMRLFTKDEQAAIRKIVSGEGLEQLLAMAAKFNPERSQLMLGSQMFLAGAGSPAAAGALGAGGFAADKALAAIQRKAAQDVMAKILAGTIKRPRDTTAWRALIEAQARSYSNPLEAPTE